MSTVVHTKQRLRLAARLAAAALLAHAGAAAAMGLEEAYQAALLNDPAYQSALFDQAAGRENEVIGRAGLLPNLSGNYSQSRNRADVTAPNALGKTGVTHPVYTSRVAGVTLRQSLFNLDALARYKQGLAQSDFSESLFQSRAQELALRVSGAYVDALFGRDQVRLAQAQRDMYREQAKVNERLFQKGEGTRTDMLETQARLDLAEAQLIEAQDNEVNARTALAAIVGQEVTGLDALAPGFHVGAPPPAGFEAMKTQALENNPEVAARAHSVEVAWQEVNKSRAGHAPRLDLVASYSKNDSETINTYTQDSVVRSIGVQLSVPIYAGGQVNAVSRQAVAGHEKAKADLQAQKDKVVAELRKQYSAVLSSVARIAALDKAVASGQLLMRATEQSIKGGVRINLDLLNAQQQLYTSERDLAQARYSYLTSTLKLRAAAGVLAPADVREVAAYFR